MPIGKDQYSSSSDLGELIRLRRSLIRVQDEARLLRRDLLRRKYSPSQPRVPAGNPTGGRWTSGSEGGGGGVGGFGFGGGGLAEFGASDGFVADESGEAAWASYSEGWSDDGTVFERDIVNRDGSTIQSEYAASRAAGWDERQTVTLNSGEKVTFETTDRTQTIRYGGPDGEIASRAIWTQSGPERDATVQPAFLDKIQRGVGAAGAILFGWQSRRNGVDGRQAVMGFEPMEFRPSMGVSGSLKLNYVGRVSQDELERACLRWPQATGFANRAADAAGPVNQYPSPAAYGTDVHSRFKEYIDDLRDLNFRAERSFSKELFESTGEAESRYGYRGSIRVDAYEYRSDGTLCIYDLKTGRAGLTDRRAEIIATATALGMRPIRRVIVTEVRPRS